MPDNGSYPSLGARRSITQQTSAPADALNPSVAPFAAGQPLKPGTKGFSPIPADYTGTLPGQPKYPKAGAVTAGPKSNFYTLGGSTPGQIEVDPDQPDRIIKPVYTESTQDKNIIRGGLSSAFYQIDHIVPRALGGTNTDANRQLLPIDVHEKKTKVQSVVNSLLYNTATDGTEAPLISRSDAINASINWQNFRLDDVPKPDANGSIPVDVAQKVWAAWHSPEAAKPTWGEILQKLNPFSKSHLTGAEVAQQLPYDPKGGVANLAGGAIKGFVQGGTLGYVDSVSADTSGHDDFMYSVATSAGALAGQLPYFIFGGALLGKAAQGLKTLPGVARYLGSIGTTAAAAKAGSPAAKSVISIANPIVAHALKEAGLFAAIGQISKQEPDSSRFERLLHDIAVGGAFGTANAMGANVAHIGGLVFMIGAASGEGVRQSAQDALLIMALHSALPQLNRVRFDAKSGVTIGQLQKSTMSLERAATESALRFYQNYGLKTPRLFEKPTKLFGEFESYTQNRLGSRMADVIDTVPGNLQILRRKAGMPLGNKASNDPATNARFEGLKKDLNIWNRQLYKGGLGQQESFMESVKDIRSLWPLFDKPKDLSPVMGGAPSEVLAVAKMYQAVGTFKPKGEALPPDVIKRLKLTPMGAVLTGPNAPSVRMTGTSGNVSPEVAANIRWIKELIKNGEKLEDMNAYVVRMGPDEGAKLGAYTRSPEQLARAGTKYDITDAEGKVVGQSTYASGRYNAGDPVIKLFVNDAAGTPRELGSWPDQASAIRLRQQWEAKGVVDSDVDVNFTRQAMSKAFDATGVNSIPVRLLKEDVAVFSKEPFSLIQIQGQEPFAYSLKLKNAAAAPEAPVEGAPPKAPPEEPDAGVPYTGPNSPIAPSTPEGIAESQRPAMDFSAETGAGSGPLQHGTVYEKINDVNNGANARRTVLPLQAALASGDPAVIKQTFRDTLGIELTADELKKIYSTSGSVTFGTIHQTLRTKAAALKFFGEEKHAGVSDSEKLKDSLVDFNKFARIFPVTAERREALRSPIIPRREPVKVETLSEKVSEAAKAGAKAMKPKKGKLPAAKSPEYFAPTAEAPLASAPEAVAAAPEFPQIFGGPKVTKSLADPSKIFEGTPADGLKAKAQAAVQGIMDALKRAGSSRFNTGETEPVERPKWPGLAEDKPGAFSILPRFLSLTPGNWKRPLGISPSKAPAIRTDLTPAEDLFIGGAKSYLSKGKPKLVKTPATKFTSGRTGREIKPDHTIESVKDEFGNLVEEKPAEYAGQELFGTADHKGAVSRMDVTKFAYDEANKLIAKHGPQEGLPEEKFTQVKAPSGKTVRISQDTQAIKDARAVKVTLDAARDTIAKYDEQNKGVSAAGKSAPVEVFVRTLNKNISEADPTTPHGRAIIAHNTAIKKGLRVVFGEDWETGWEVANILNPGNKKVGKVQFDMPVERDAEKGRMYQEKSHDTSLALRWAAKNTGDPDLERMPINEKVDDPLTSIKRLPRTTKKSGGGDKEAGANIAMPEFAERSFGVEDVTYKVGVEPGDLKAGGALEGRISPNDELKTEPASKIMMNPKGGAARSVIAREIPSAIDPNTGELRNIAALRNEEQKFMDEHVIPGRGLTKAGFEKLHGILTRAQFGDKPTDLGPISVREAAEDGVNFVKEMAGTLNRYYDIPALEAIVREVTAPTSKFTASGLHKRLESLRLTTNAKPTDYSVSAALTKAKSYAKMNYGVDAPSNRPKIKMKSDMEHDRAGKIAAIRAEAEFRNLDDNMKGDNINDPSPPLKAGQAGRLIVAGGASVDTSPLRLEDAIKKFGITGARGLVTGGGKTPADMASNHLAKGKGMPLKVFEPKWTAVGNGAAYERNTEMAKFGDSLVALHDGDPVTSDLINKMKAAGKPVYVLNSKRVGANSSSLTRESFNVPKAEGPKVEAEGTKAPIKSFDRNGPNGFLSNFEPASVTLDGKTYPSVEHAYVAAKTDDPAIRQAISQLKTAAEAKAAGKRLPLKAGWDQSKFGTMEDLVRQKFSDPALKAKLLATGDQHLEEGNTWGDTTWGTHNGVGENALGKILMKVRSELQGGTAPAKAVHPYKAHLDSLKSEKPAPAVSSDKDYLKGLMDEIKRTKK